MLFFLCYDKKPFLSICVLYAPLCYHNRLPWLCAFDLLPLEPVFVDSTNKLLSFLNPLLFCGQSEGSFLFTPTMAFFRLYAPPVSRELLKGEAGYLVPFLSNK